MEQIYNPYLPLWEYVPVGNRIYLMEECIFTVLMTKQMALPIVRGIM